MRVREQPPVTYTHRMRLIYVRHCEPAWPQGWAAADPGLTDLGRRQAEATAAELASRLEHGLAVTSMIAGTRQRALETASIIAGRLGLPVIIDDTLAGTGIEDPQVKRRLSEDVWDAAATDALAGVQASVWDAVTKRAASTPDETLLIASHDSVIGALVCAALGLPPAGLRRLRIDMGSLTTLDLRPGRAMLSSLNETSHLAGLLRREARYDGAVDVPPA